MARPSHIFRGYCTAIRKSSIEKIESPSLAATFTSRTFVAHSDRSHSAGPS
jgi:hypothetical protein